MSGKIVAMACGAVLCTTAGLLAWRLVTVGPAPAASAQMAPRETAKALPGAARVDVAIGAPSKIDAAHFPDQIARAKNDPKFAYELALALLACRRSSGALDAISDLNEAGRPEVAARMMDRAEASQAPCAGLSQQQLDAYRDLVESSAEHGDLEAMVNYSDMLAETVLSPESIANPDGIERYRRKSMEYLSKAADLGDRRALMKLSTAYEGGILTREDHLQAYKYAYAYAQATSNGNADRWVSYLERGMSAKEVEIAQALGNGYARRCCR